MVELKTRPLGATARLGRSGYPNVRSATGGEINLVTGASQLGFDPIDLLLASLAACIGMSVRIAARRLGHADRFDEATVEATADKEKDGSHRINRFVVAITLKGQIETADQHAIAELAESICTVSNALSPRPELVLRPIDELGQAVSPPATP